MADDSLVPGLDISSFSPEKLNRLQQFADVFAKLETFHGKSISPINTAGVTAFNVSLEETNVLLTQIGVKLDALKPKVASVGNQGAEGTAKLGNSAKFANTQFGELGKTLTKNLSLLRTIAYILPGIGLAGIFNLAFIGIEKAFEALTGFTGETKNLVKEETSLVKIINELNASLRQTNELLRASNYLFNQTEGNITQLEKELAFYKALGENIDFVSKKKIELDKLKTGKSLADIKLNTGEKNDVDAIFAQGILVDKIGIRISHINADIRKLAESDAFKNEKKQDGKFHTDMKNLETLKKSFEDYYKEQNGLILEYNKNSIQEGIDKLKLEKDLLDQSRVQFVKNEKEKADSVIAANEIIAKSNSSTEQEKINAEIAVSKQRRRLSFLDLYNVTEDKTRDGRPSKTPSEISQAQVKFDNEIIRESGRLHSVLTIISEDYYQRNLKARTETAKNEIDAEAEKNQRISEDLEKELEERLQAYTIYIKDKIAEQELERKKDLDVLGKTPAERDEINSNADAQILKIKADSERKIYDIVYTWSQRRLKDTIKTNNLQEQENKRAYAEELDLLNEKFEKGEVGYKNFIKLRQSLDTKYKIDSAREDIKNERQELENLKRLLEKEKEVRDTFQDQANNSTNPEDKANALSGVASSKDAIANTEQAILDKRKSLDGKLLALGKSTGDQELEYKKEIADNNRKIEEESLNLAKKIIDERTQYEIDAIERRQKVIDESYDGEIAAIERSSLSAKDKIALDVQLAEQKKESDKAAMAEERRLKREAAIIDRDLAIAKITYETEVAVMSALELPPPFGEILAIQRGILGGIALATVLATPIPSFAEGVIDFKGGMARYGEAGPEIVAKPYQSPYLVSNETIGYLPPGTDIIPLNSPVFNNRAEDSSWEQTKFLADIIKAQKADKPKVTNNITINVDNNYRKRILGN